VDTPRSQRVLLVTKGLDLGGIERVVTDLAIGLRERGVDAEVAVVNPDRDHLVPPLERAGVPIHVLGGSDRIGIGAARRLARLIRRGGYDTVHVHGPLVAALVRTVRRGTPVVSTAHTPWESLHPLTRLAWRATARRDAVTLAVSEAVRTSLPTESEVLPHGVDATLADQARSASGARSGDRVVVVTVASHRDAKNYPNLLRGVRHAIDLGVELRLVAYGEGDGLEQHRAMAAQLGLADTIDFEPPVVEILPAIAAADLLVVASDYEGQPLVVAEAQAVGRAVVATEVGRIPEMVDASTGIIVQPGDPTALGTALAELAADPARREAMGTAALARAGQWTLGDVLDRHVAIYSSIIDRPSAADAA
jgi:glycosyltransferase involved in cell wall biosynthesis